MAFGQGLHECLGVNSDCGAEHDISGTNGYRLAKVGGFGPFSDPVPWGSSVMSRLYADCLSAAAIYGLTWRNAGGKTRLGLPAADGGSCTSARSGRWPAS